MKLIRNLLIALSLFVSPVAMAQVTIPETTPVCQKLEEFKSGIPDLQKALRDSGQDDRIDTISIDGEAFVAFLKVLTENFGAPPHPVASAFTLSANGTSVLVFFSEDGCAKFTVPIPTEALNIFLRQAMR